MAVTSKREKVLAYLKSTTIPLINGVGDYNLTPAVISREFRSLEGLDKHQFPAVFILDDAPVSYAPMTNRGYTTGTSILDLESGMTVAIVGHVKVDTETRMDLDGTLSTEMNKIFSDIMIAMDKDITLGGNCMSVVLTHSDHATNYSKKFGVGQVLMLYSIKYDFNPSNSIT